MANRRVLTVSGDSKTIKGEAFGYLTGIQYFAPHTLSGHNMCHWAAECKGPCLYTSGRGAGFNIQNKRIAKTKRFVEKTAEYLADLDWSIKALIRKAKREGLKPVARLDGTSDNRWDIIAPHLFDNDCQFYDYTKNPKKMQDFLDGKLPSNYDITFSWSGSNLDECLDFLSQGGNVAIPMDPIPEVYKGFPVIIGDENDLRFMDHKGYWVALTPKGRARKDKSGFVIWDAPLIS